jgi:hypothetical protein
MERGSSAWAQSRRVRLANIAEGTHPHGVLNKLADVAITQRFLLYKVGSDIDHIAVAGATDLAIGTVDDEVATADITDTYVSLNLLGKGNGTKRMVANAAITAGARVFQAASGKVAPSGTRCVGVALMAAAADGDVIEVDDVAHLGAPGGYTLMFAGIRTWAAGAAVTEGFAVAGVLATDLVLATPVAVAGAGLLQKVVPTTDTLTATTNANWANGDKYSYQVWRAA